eukprot:TRINITY_DN110200_c0_g1_i1.p1 TRINITY_DN110200_c0_g1~~TRINITY_DN110200_c0_g1_i1.p1  ORF type:complete len:451 (-),score=70.19 TRINITY_DN110200_c0_g1_i1:114-1466(-)
MANVTEHLQKFTCNAEAIDFAADDALQHLLHDVKSCLKSIREVRHASSNDYTFSFCGIETALSDIAADSKEVYPQVFREGLTFAARKLMESLASDHSIVHAEQDSSIFSYQLSEPEAAATMDSRHSVTRLQCLEILAAGFFGIISRSDWGKRKHNSRMSDMPAFTFDKLWEYDSARWGTKNFVLMGVLLYFWQVSRLVDTELEGQHLTITRKAIGAVAVSDSDVFCAFELQQDGVSIHDFAGAEHLQADFANEYLGGGVMSGGGSQEESMFIEYTELLVTVFLVEKMLPFEAVEITGAQKYIEHNMMGSRNRQRETQFCRPAGLANSPITAVAMDAICFNSYGKVSKSSQYQSVHVQREMRKCLAALSLPEEADTGTRRSFVTGLWGCGAFRGDAELKCMIQWMCCSLEPSVGKLIFCPFDQHQRLIDSGLVQLIETLGGKVSVKAVFDL